jgi:outer membrane lipoprotein carrier protein
MGKSVLGWLCIALLVMGTAAAAATADTSDQALDKILDGIEKRYAGPGFSAHFFQESTLKAMQLNDTAQGKLIVKRPDKMRWEYSQPDEQIIITDGRSLWIYRPEDNQVMVGKAPDFFGDGKGAGFLTDMNRIRGSFGIQLQPAENEAYYRLDMIPLKPSPELSRVVLSVSKKTYQVDQVITTNSYGDETRIVLSDYHFNLNPEDGLFTFDIPDGTDVIRVDNNGVE